LRRLPGLARGRRIDIDAGAVDCRIGAAAEREVAIGGADKLFGAGGKLINDGTRIFLQSFMQAYAAWIAANARV
jgi:hypothetical protein